MPSVITWWNHAVLLQSFDFETFLAPDSRSTLYLSALSCLIAFSLFHASTYNSD